MFKPLPKAATTTVFALAALAAPTAAIASPLAPAARCAPDYHMVVKEIGKPTYLPLASTAGKFNASNKSSTLHYSLSTTKERSTEWASGGGAGINFGIVQIEAHTDYTVTETVARGTEVSNDLDVPAKHYGYVTPTAQVRTFWITERFYTRDCVEKIDENFGVMKAITAVPFFKECVTKKESGCTPKKPRGTTN
jgi:hypothetical protein